MGNCCPPGSSSEPDPPPASSGSSRPAGSAGAAASPATISPSAAPAPAKPPAPIGPVLGRPMEDVKSIYTVGKELGRGQFGVTSLCTHKATGQRFACKTISKRKLSTKEDVEDVRREVQIMYHLAGQPGVVELKGAYEDKHAVHLVMELCAGGELFDRIIAKGHYTEHAASSLLRTIVEIIHTCHSMGVIHRDLKPENFLLLSKDEHAPLKATDFGLSVFFKEGEVFRDIVGSAYYIAPEVLKRSYGPEADIWSIGVMLYILLCGVPPFWAESEHGIFNSILRGHVDFSSEPWSRISHGAKDLVRRMLHSDPKQRISAYDVLNHPWIKEDGEAPDTPLDNAVLGRLKQFRAMNQFKKAALRVIAGCLSEEEIRGLKEMFKSMDSDNSGTITVDELRKGLAKKGTKLTEAEVQQLMEAVRIATLTRIIWNCTSHSENFQTYKMFVDLGGKKQADADGNGTIDYEEFITATMHMNRMDREEHLYTAFQYFDKDNSGYITIEELEQALREKGLMDGREIKDIISEVDADNDGRINYTEFVAMMRKGDPEANPKKRRDVVL
ncbi:calcium-dependent protein kinase 14 isoform X1 [Oryza glaberrima]|uniref:calcium-dependent protein kinase 14 isoform X1 n=1 Tax=Oryza glaberrima TaxID=4538 RepID=UPI000E1B73C1|nr:calcium-dependent protein kinase 14 isoform X1 [Oryza glaberrima]